MGFRTGPGGERHHRILILGGGSAGITTAARLRRARRKLDIGLVEPSDTHCPLLTDVGKLVLAEFTYGNTYAPTFPVDQTRERLDMYLLKRYALPQLYWHGMLRGRA